MFDSYIEKYGVDVVLKKRTVTGEDEYGHPTVSYSEENMRAIIRIPSSKEASIIKEAGVFFNNVLFFILPSYANVSPLDIVVFDEKEYVVRKVQKIYYMNKVVAVKVLAVYKA